MRRGGDADVVTSTDGGRNWVELVATVLLAVATVATAWSGYQSTRTRLRVVMLCIGCAVFLCTAIWIATSPVSLSV